MSNLSDETERQERALETAAREYAKHSGPTSDERERGTFSRDLRAAAMRYARAYYAEARELGLIPEYELARCRGCGSPDHRFTDAVCAQDNS